MAGDYAGVGLSRLCCLIDDSTSRFNLEEMELSRDKEREMLIYLSKVFKELQGCIDGHGGLIEDLEEPANNGVCQDLNLGNLQRLTSSLFRLMSFLTVKSKYVQHLVGNIFVAASQLIATSVSEPEPVVQFAKALSWNPECLDISIFNALSSSSAFSVLDKELSNFHHQGSEVLRERLENADWYTAAETLRILRRIIKHLKEEQDERRAEALISSLKSCVVKFPLFCGTFAAAGQTTSRMNSGETESMVLFLGNLIQLFCSLPELDVSEDSSPGSQNEHSMLHMLNNILPEIFKSCLDQEDTHIYPYFQHKLLVLLTRLSSQLPCDCGSVSSWLHILHSYYENLLMRPISRGYHAQDDCLEGSSFLWSLYDGEESLPSSLHLQRKTIFLFLRCWLSLIDQGVSSNSNCACVRLNYVSDPNKVQFCSGREKGILELYRWLEVHVPFTMLTDSKSYMGNCITFASSFIGLYIHEDDMLFEVLLQLFNIVTYAEKQDLKEEDDIEKVNQDAVCHIANVFNPLLLFHWFLAEIKYDHHLLLDYLISKDLGIRFAEYLLRGLRKVCDSWQEFVDLPVKERVYVPKSYKKRKTSLELPRSYKDSLTTALQIKIASSNVEHEKGNGSEMTCAKESLQIMKAKTCLLSLKDSLIKLQRKNLFPYNPEVLLRRLKRFEELCSRHG